MELLPDVLNIIMYEKKKSYLKPFIAPIRKNLAKSIECYCKPGQ